MIASIVNHHSDQYRFARVPRSAACATTMPFMPHFPSIAGLAESEFCLLTRTGVGPFCMVS